MDRKRLKIVCITFGVLLGALVGKLVYIQLIGHEDLSQAAASQQLIALQGANTRGLIYDCNGTPLVGNSMEYIFIIREKQLDGEAQNALNILGAEEIKNGDNGYRVFASSRYDKKTGERLIRNASAYIIEAGRRYSRQQPAVHMLGYVNPRDFSGAAGIEKMCDKELSLLNKKIFTTADVKGNLIPGRGLVVSTAMEADSYVKKGVATTLDAGLQKKVEEALAKSGKNAAAVVIKSKSGEIAAAASTPVFDPNKISSYMDSRRQELINKVTQGEYPPGSVFKIAVAAATLEQGIQPEQTFVCKGYEEINGKRINCKTGGKNGHGTITLKEAFSQSCNSAFIQAGRQTGADAVLNMAYKLGLGQRVLEDYPDEKEGNLMTAYQSGGAAIANLSIGQGELLTTPLQVAKMTNIIAAQGKNPQIHLLLQEEAREAGQQIIRRETAEKIMEMMRQTMITGSGKSLTADVEMAGKTGSAESRMAGHDAVHGWMTGFVPANDPEYTITVFVEDVESGSSSAGPVFAEIAQYLSDSGSFEQALGF